MFSVLVGLAGVVAIPAAIVSAEAYEVVTLLESSIAIPPAFVLSLGAIYLGRRGRRAVERTLGRTRGRSLAATGRTLGYVSLYLAVTAGISVATYYLLREFAA